MIDLRFDPLELALLDEEFPSRRFARLALGVWRDRRLFPPPGRRALVARWRHTGRWPDVRLLPHLRDEAGRRLLGAVRVDPPVLWFDRTAIDRLPAAVLSRLILHELYHLVGVGDEAECDRRSGWTPQDDRAVKAAVPV